MTGRRTITRWVAGALAGAGLLAACSADDDALDAADGTVETVPLDSVDLASGVATTDEPDPDPPMLGTATTAAVADDAAQLGTSTTIDVPEGIDPLLAPPSTEPAGPGHLIATATTATTSVDVLAEPGGAVTTTLANPTATGAPLTFLAVDHTGDWLQVLVPVRPNGTTGWVSTADVDLARTHLRVEVRLSDHRLTVYEGDRPVLREPIGVGTTDTPTPGGLYFLTELLRPPDPDGPYGHYAFGLSGYSETLTSFGGGDGVIGIHGTNDPDSLGEDVSHGCIRISNDAIDAMASLLPLGTPVQILP
ncbi:MAG: L,D-transpeptidase family protein [Actinomycetota bacterium]|nr:L,D-transpeptidase family protein [Actinomycetota bacterium]